MNLFKSLFRSRGKPVEDRVAGNSCDSFHWQTTSQRPVTQRSAMQMTAVYSCVRILSEAIAGLPRNWFINEGSLLTQHWTGSGYLDRKKEMTPTTVKKIAGQAEFDAF